MPPRFISLVLPKFPQIGELYDPNQHQLGSFCIDTQSKGPLQPDALSGEKGFENRCLITVAPIARITFGEDALNIFNSLPQITLYRIKSSPSCDARLERARQSELGRMTVIGIGPFRALTVRPRRAGPRRETDPGPNGWLARYSGILCSRDLDENQFDHDLLLREDQRDEAAPPGKHTKRDSATRLVSCQIPHLAREMLIVVGEAAVAQGLSALYEVIRGKNRNTWAEMQVA
ncbi:hypothetical protein FB451DRAFT_1186008 [Mycena latifolia]|nr:hypothetical protein FB451DRAFT_1186008 [Mycena latifolia]